MLSNGSQALCQARRRCSVVRLPQGVKKDLEVSFSFSSSSHLSKSNRHMF